LGKRRLYFSSNVHLRTVDWTTGQGLTSPQEQ